jgi:G3E family GTPase
LLGEGLFAAVEGGQEICRWLDPGAYARTDDAGFAAEPALGAESVAAAYERQQHRGETPTHGTGHNHGDDIRSFCLVRDRPVSLSTLQLFLDAISRDAGPNLLRVKGLVNVAEEPDRPAVIQGAQQIIHSLDWLPGWPTDDRRTRIVFITRHIEQAHVEDAFALIERIARRTAIAAGHTA